MAAEVNIHPSWKNVLKDEFEKPYFQQLRAFLRQEKLNKKIIYPPGPLIFNAFDHCPFDQVKVVILGQDPYHGAGQAMGLSFSVPKQITIPASLKNIYKELNTDLQIPIATHGDLTSWADQGVFLLNAILTVEQSRPGAHQKSGWQDFTDAVIKTLSAKKDGLVFLLWGNYAKNKKVLIDEMKHFVLEAAHPSPLAGGAFFGCKHFSKTNELLLKQHKKPIQWKIEI
ncbi:MAG: uracil-DNA glycosylase [Saprospiraceae bacterium]|jgi:uracil-DNA glycosylase|nr:uracil-DNA glycosylase [Saprospiraceae bacterium]MBK7371124.1 uracil-DNA glycosylase [Saprospiraceae bacterium]MBK7436376.1 uracil-DNA glycosylase [Saprospiraceae bacterium]MBK8514504.1 uracil-DNA glycosylase [Saprospiraceae bacterium]MBK9679952.1 uracil-DNA glycosylase [Saprospiraceae bacterium]